MQGARLFIACHGLHINSELLLVC